MRRRQRGAPAVPAPAPAAAPPGPPAPPVGYLVGSPTAAQVIAAADELGLDNSDVSWALRRGEINDSPITVTGVGRSVTLCHETYRTTGSGARKNRRNGTANITFFYASGANEGEYYLVAWGNHRTDGSYRVEGAVAGMEWLVGQTIHF